MVKSVHGSPFMYSSGMVHFGNETFPVEHFNFEVVEVPSIVPMPLHWFGYLDKQEMDEEVEETITRILTPTCEEGEGGDDGDDDSDDDDDDSDDDADQDEEDDDEEVTDPKAKKAIDKAYAKLREAEKREKAAQKKVKEAERKGLGGQAKAEAERDDAQAEAAELKLRLDRIEAETVITDTAEALKFRNVKGAKRFIPKDMTDPEEIKKELKAVLKEFPELKGSGGKEPLPVGGDGDNSSGDDMNARIRGMRGN